MTGHLSRRDVLKIGASSAAAAFLSSCGIDRQAGGLFTDGDGDTGTASAKQGRLGARPSPSIPRGTPAHGLHALGLGGRRDGLIYVPRSYRDDRSAPFALTLHGAGGNARKGIGPLLREAEDAGLVLLAPESRGRTWDLMLGGFGPDVAFIDRALKHMFERYAVDPRHLAVQGFSDGASYSLSLGITNGDLFTHVFAFSPGYAAPGQPHGSPRVFISHGTDDQVLPIDATSRKIVPALKKEGYDVRYEEFIGRHGMNHGVTAAAVHDWFLG